MESSSHSDNDRNKRKMKNVNSGVDYISQLPEAILLYLLTFFPTKDLMVLSFLSRFWKAMIVSHLSTVPSSLKFIEYEMVERFMHQRVPYPIPDVHGPTYLLNSAKQQFTDFVTRTLMLHTGCTIDNLELSVWNNGNPKFTKKVNSWVVFSFTNKIKVLSLEFATGYYEMPSGGFSPPMLHTLTLTYCTVRAVTFGVMVSLRNLELKRIKFTNCNFGDLVSKCPVLEDVSLVQCVFPDSFMLCREDLTIKRLTMIDCRSEELPMFTMSISTPELLSLVFIGRLLMISYIRNATKLQDAVIQVMQIYADHVQGDALGAMLNGLVHCKTISINSWCIQVLPTGEQLLHQLRAPLTHVEHLKFTVALEKQEFPGIACLIRSCPNLKMITLFLENPVEIDWTDFEDDIPDILNFNEANYWQSQELPFQCMETSLKLVTMFGYKSTGHEKNLVRFILGKSAVLEYIDLYYDAAHITAAEATDQQLNTMWKIDTDDALCYAPRLNNQAQVMVYKPVGPRINQSFFNYFD